MSVPWILSMLFAVVHCQNMSSGLADVLSNYAKVSVNQVSTQIIETPSTPLHMSTTTTETSKITDDEEKYDYEDFDDSSATEQSKSTDMNGLSMLKFVSGLVNLLALMTQYGDRPQVPEKRKAPMRGRNADPLADTINGLAVAQDRYNPTTATKKFKLAQGGYPPLNQSPVYAPPGPSPADSYSSNGGKTSYDSDASEYMVKNPDTNTFQDTMMMRPVMKDYMKQNEPPVDIQQSYSYQLPSEVVSSKPATVGYSYGLPDKPKNKPYVNDVMHDEDHDEDKPLGPIYYPWNKKPKQPAPLPAPPMEPEPADDEHDHFDVHPKSPKYPEQSFYSWQNPPKKTKPMPPPDYDNTPDMPSWEMKKKAPPIDMEPNEDEDQEIPPWETKSPKGAYNDHAYPYSPYPDHEHGLLYPGDDDHHGHHDEQDHDLKDEDRESKRPYTYYHLGRKLWYVPLLFSLYFIVYIGALLLKSIARHKVQFPEKLWEVHDHHHDRRRRTINSVTENILRSIEKSGNKFM